MTTQVRSLGYTNSLQRLVWAGTNNTRVTAYLWGAGGGGGGNDSGAGGAGSGGGFTQYTFTVDDGDVIQVAVGGKGYAGSSGASAAAGGKGGSSYFENSVFNSRTALADPPTVPSTNGAYVSFLNTYGVWNSDIGSANFDRSYSVNFPRTGSYTFTASCDNFGTVSLDGTNILSVPGFTSTYTVNQTVTSGIHTVRMLGTNTGGPGSFGLTITDASGQGYYGGVGGAAGPAGSSGGGGGGGGATVLILNGSVVAVAGGGGGGGGAGNRGTRNGDNAPGSAGQSGTFTVGGDGAVKGGDGGGGGAGGGGLRGGLGGGLRDGDQGALAGSFGLSSSPAANPNGRNPGGQSNQYYVGNPGVGGTTASDGVSGYAVFEFGLTGVFVHEDGTFVGAQPFVKFNNVWNSVQAVWIKNDGVWRPVIGYTAPEFTTVPNNFGGPGRICISVIDECSAKASSNQNSWNSFISLYPGTPMYLLQPGGPSRGDLRVPSNFNSSGQGFGPIAVNRDNGNSSNRSDWFALCGLSAYPPGSWVQVSIDNSGSMTFGTVSASYNYLVEQCQAAGFTVSTATMSGERWVAPFV
jgi:hypothetical protein